MLRQDWVSLFLSFLVIFLIFITMVTYVVWGYEDNSKIYLAPVEGKLLKLESLGRIIHVPGEYQSIQTAINFSSYGDTVLVAPGGYFENINFCGKAITLASYFILGNHDSNLIDSTIIDGSMLTCHLDSGSVVTFVSGEDSNSVLIGFTITGGNGTLKPKPPGKAERRGGGIYCYGSSPLIINNKIIDNHIADGVVDYREGGGICCFASDARIVNNLILNNSSDYTIGGGVYLWGSYTGEPKIINNIIANNDGGGIVIQGTYPIIANNIIVSNINGGGIDFISPPVNSTVSYNDVWNNQDNNFLNCPPVIGIMDTINFNNSPSDTFFNIILNPIFVDSASDYHLQASSPCINAGGNEYIPDIYFDFDFNDRMVGCYMDMGVNEFRYLCGDANANGEITISDIVYIISYLYKDGPFPQPIQTGDANCDSEVAISDVVYLINYLFKGGSPPCD